jgi:hypothetical protein
VESNTVTATVSMVQTVQNRKLKNSNIEKVLSTIKPANPSTNEKIKEIRKIFLNLRLPMITHLNG